MFEGWGEFYLLIGSAAAALIGLLFVVATLTSDLEEQSATRGTVVYMTPTVFHFAVVLALSALALAPHAPAAVHAAAAAVCALAGLAYTAAVAFQIRKGAMTEPPHWSDVWFYGAAPAAVYLALGAIAVALWQADSLAPSGLAAALLALLLVCVRNAWDLVTYLAPRHASGGKDG